MKTRRLMTVKPHKYGTRHLTAGEEYEAPIKHAFALVAGKKARFAADKPARASKTRIEAAVEETTETAETSETTAAPTETAIDQLRLQATQLGVAIDGRWGVARLQHEIMQKKRWG